MGELKAIKELSEEIFSKSFRDICSTLNIIFYKSKVKRKFIFSAILIIIKKNTFVANCIFFNNV